MANYSKSGHEFINVDMQNSMSELDQSFSNPLYISGTSSTFGMVITTTRNAAINGQDTQSDNGQDTQPTIEKDVHNNDGPCSYARDEDASVKHKNPGDNTEQMDDAVDNVELVSKSSHKQMPASQEVEEGCPVSNSELAVGSDSEIELECSNDHNTRLLQRCNKQTETLRKYKKKIDAKDVQIAQLKDLVVHAVSEAKAAKQDPNAKLVSCYDFQKIFKLKEFWNLFTYFLNEKLI